MFKYLLDVVNVLLLNITCFLKVEIIDCTKSLGNL